MTSKQANLRRLRAVLARRKHPVILIYGNPDPDALASAWALKEIMRGSRAAPAIVYTGTVGRQENEAMIRLLRIPAEPLRGSRLEAADGVALVDCQPDFFQDVALPPCDAVFDHHPIRTASVAAFVDIRPDCLATASILTEYLQTGGIPVSRRLATALNYGIQTDGRHRQRAHTATDWNALTFLDPKVDWPLLRRIEFSSYSLGLLDYFSIALIRLRHFHHVLYSNVGPVSSADVCAQIADFLIRVQESNWAVVSGTVDRRLIIVFRCDGQKKDAGKTAQAAFGDRGSAGGHRTMGRAEIAEDRLPGRMLVTQTERIERFVLGSLAKRERVFRTILRALHS